MTYLKAAALAVVAVLAVGCGSAATGTPELALKTSSPKATKATSAPKPTPSAPPRKARHRTARHKAATAPKAPPKTSAPQPTPTSAPPTSAPPPPPTGSSNCSTSAQKGECGPYGDSRITGTTSDTSVGNNVWAPISGWAQRLYANSPSDWSVTSNMPAGNTAVVSYPSLGANFGLSSGKPTPLSDYSSMYSSFREDMHARSSTSAWAAYDIWLGPSSSTSANHEVMIQHDFANNGACGAEASATFGGSGGVPVRKWNLCQFGSELVWKLTGGNEQSGTVDVKAMLGWLVTHGYLPSNTGLFSVGYGWEICSTGGKNENFQVSNFSITARK